MHTVGFDSAVYLAAQKEAILQRAEMFDNKLYLEFGGKLASDLHAARVLPGYDPNAKLRLLQQLREQADILLCIHAGAIESRKVRGDFGISYDADALRLIDELREWGLEVCAVVITRFANQPSAIQFKSRLEHRGVRVYCHAPTRGYPTDINTIVSPDGYGANPYIETTRPLVVVTGPGPGSGKLATCLNQIYHDRLAGHSSGYAKFETFPVWDLPLHHPVNVAYEAATADLCDVNMVDPFHLEKRGVTAINYNRDIAAFPLLGAIWERLTHAPCPYVSPTEMGVNRIRQGIVDDAVVREAANQELIRRYFRYACEFAMGMTGHATVERIERLLEDQGLTVEDRPVVVAARAAAQSNDARTLVPDGVRCGTAIELPDGRIVSGRNSPLFHSAASAILNAIKALAGIPDGIHLLAPDVLHSIIHMKEDILRGKNASLNVDEMLIALSMSAARDPNAHAAMEKLADLRGCEMHLSHLPALGDEAGLRRLGLRPTAEPHFANSDLYQGD
ncbi:MAG: DUF1846 domain-containing protein [Kiritimatiellia bacterium]|jgi:uncharacterized protein (UPF0371 family)